MATLIVYGVIALGLLVAFWGAFQHVVGIGRDQIRLEYAPLLKVCSNLKWNAEACALDWETARADRVLLKAQVEDARSAARECSDGVDKMGKAALEALKRGQKEIQERGLTIDAIRRERDAALALAQRPAIGGTCEERLARLTHSLDELSARELRFRPPGAAGAASTDGDRSGAGAGSLRVR